jgi:hypothetical protein
MIRQLLVTNERAHVLRSPSNTALVIGNPKVSDPRFPPLPGAAEEARQVAALLDASGSDGDANRWTVETLLDDAASPMEVHMALHERPWRVLHIAAHGVFEFDTGKKTVSGLVLDGSFFTAEQADKLRYVPDLVFINCCHLGQTRGDAEPFVAFHRLAANLATQFIRMGARAVVAAGWEVDDAAAKTFAAGFYKRMLNGELYGDAIHGARKDTYLNHDGTNTWGAYQCYGDPSFSLVQGTPSRPATFVSEAELCVWLEGLIASMRSASKDDDSLKQLESAIADTPAAWWRSAELCARAAEAFLELGAFERAIGYFESVTRTERANASIRTLEQFANCKVRWAGQLIRENPWDPRVAALLDDARLILESLLQLGETSERWSLVGGVHKRRALAVTARPERQRALKEMSKAYGRAYDVASGNGENGAYPLANQLAADIVLNWAPRAKKTDGTKSILERLDKLDAAAIALAASSTDAYDLSAAAERRLMNALARRKITEDIRKEIEQKYLEALSRGATARKRDSMRTQFHYFRTLMSMEFPARGRADIIEHMNKLEVKVLG